MRYSYLNFASSSCLPEVHAYRDMCLDSIVQVRMRVWRRDANGSRNPEPLFDLNTKCGAVEVGGGPWWSTWSAQVRQA